MSMALMATASVSFTACNDDDPEYEPVTVIGSDKDNSSIQFTTDECRIKIGADNRVAIPIAESVGAIRAYSLSPDVVEVVDVDGALMLEGFKNGTGSVMVADENDVYKALHVSVYTTDKMELSHAELTLSAPLGASASTDEAYVSLGNGGYSIVSNNEAVEATIDSETGAIVITGTSKADPYTATLTVTDASGLTEDIKVTVTPSFDPFTPAQLQEIMAKTESAVWADCKDPSDGNEPYYYDWRDWGYGEWLNTSENGTNTLGWWCTSYGSDLGGIKIEYPSDAAVDAEVNGALYFQYSNIQWYNCYKYEGKAKVLVDNADKTVVICWQVDKANVRINRGYVVMMKN